MNEIFPDRVEKVPSIATQLEWWNIFWRVRWQMFFPNSSTKSEFPTWSISPRKKVVQSVDEIYKYDHARQVEMSIAKPWTKDPHYFKTIKISALALLKMVMHARSGKNLEVYAVACYSIVCQQSYRQMWHHITDMKIWVVDHNMEKEINLFFSNFTG